MQFAYVATYSCSEMGLLWRIQSTSLNLDQSGESEAFIAIEIMWLDTTVLEQHDHFSFIIRQNCGPLSPDAHDPERKNLHDVKEI